MVADMQVDKVADIVAYMQIDKVSNMVADMEVNMVANMEDVSKLLRVKDFVSLNFFKPNLIQVCASSKLC